jgi:glutaredoxin
MLDLDAKIYPCPKGGHKFRKELVKRGGKEMVPLLIDPNANAQMYESSDIVRYLFKTYGGGEENIPFPLNAGYLDTVDSKVATIIRIFPLNQGLVRELAEKPGQPLIFYNFEANPECRRVRETLSSLEIPYTMINLAPELSSSTNIPFVGVSLATARANKSEKRRRIEAEIGPHFDLPYLRDPNNNTDKVGVDEIIEYLLNEYKIQ